MRELEPTVFVVDDDAPTLRELEALLKSVRLRTEPYLSAEDFLRDYDRSCPGCLILEDCLPGLGGIGAYRRLRQDGDSIPVIFLAGHSTVRAAVRAMQEGAFDYLEKPFDHSYLVERVQAAIAQDQENRRQEARREEIIRRFQNLSSREIAVLDQLIAGRTSKTIARHLGIGSKTVDVHRANIMKKVGANTPADLVYLALQSGHSRERPFSKLQDRLCITA